MRIANILTAVALAGTPSVALAQVENMGPKAATYITDEDVKKVNALPGVDRQIVSVDIGKLNEAVGIVHRGTTRGAKPPAPPAGANAPAPAPCGEQAATPVAGSSGSGISHDHQTETYIIVSGSGTLITGGRVVNGRKSAPDSPVTTVLNGPSCSGVIAGAGRGHPGGQDRRHHHHSGRRAARLERHRGPRGLPQRTPRSGPGAEALRAPGFAEEVSLQGGRRGRSP